MQTVIQRVFEFVRASARPVSTREILAAIEGANSSSVTFSLSKLVRTNELERTGHGYYIVAQARAAESQAPPAAWLLQDPYWERLFELIRPVLTMADLAYLYETVAVGRRYSPLPTEYMAARDSPPLDKT